MMGFGMKGKSEKQPEVAIEKVLSYSLRVKNGGVSEVSLGAR